MLDATGRGWLGLGLMTGLLAIDAARCIRRRRRLLAEIDAFMEWHSFQEPGRPVPPPLSPTRGHHDQASCVD